MIRAAALLLSALLAACASSPGNPQGTLDREHEREAAQLRRETAEPVDRSKLMLDLEHALADYVQALANQGVIRSDKHRQTFDHYLRETVARHYQYLVSEAQSAEVPANRGIAVAALGFARLDADPRPMPVILAAAEAEDHRTVDRAVLGLAILADPETPPGVLQRIADDDTFGEESRAQAAWALYCLQEASSAHTPEIVDYWVQVVKRPLLAVPAGVLWQAVRGLGLTRDKQYAPLVAPLATHPVARVRMNVAIALGRMNAQEQYEALLAMLGTAETNPNVRLFASIALRELAGGTDRGYDVEQWRKVFQRGKQ